jgi:lipopolysaccharide/colanic/teichoic acid biosynthesis glycosyltransferase
MATEKTLVFWYLPLNSFRASEFVPFLGSNFEVRYFTVDVPDYQLIEADFPEVVVLDGAVKNDLRSAFKDRLRDANSLIILHSAQYDPDVKKKAITWKADEYFFGEVNAELFDQISRSLAYRKNTSPIVNAASVIDPHNLPVFRFWRFKRAFDIAIASMAILALSPIFILIALIIRLESRGPIIYKSKRAGSGYKIFNFYKFRSMRQDADKLLKALAEQNQYSNQGDAVFYKFKDDPRVTRFGRFIRKTSIDELPQLFNVLLGDMSLVGNRPLPLYEAEKLTRDNMAWRFIAPAGLTGLWQITKRGKDNMTPEERIQLDIEYAQKNSLMLDIRILFMTLPALIQKERV